MATNTEMIIKIASSVAVIESTVTDLKKAVMGNGKKGLLDRVHDIETRHCNEDEDEVENKEKQKEKRKEIKDKKEKWGARAWGLVAGVLLYLIIQTIVFVNLFERISAVIK